MTQTDSLRMGHSGVLVNFAEQVLAVDELKRPPPQIAKEYLAPLELLRLTVRDKANEVFVGKLSRISEALAQTAPSTGTRDDELHFGEVQGVGVVQVGDKLISEKRPDTGVAKKNFVRLPHRRGGS